MQLTSLKFDQSKLTSQISRSSQKAGISVAQLSSGNRLVRAADDVAALSVSTGMSTRITALRSGSINISHAISLLQVADDGLRNMDNALQRMNALAVQAGSGALSSAERGFLDLEFQALKEELGRILEVTEFNGRKVYKTAASTFETAGVSSESEALFNPLNTSDIALWLDADDSSQIELTYATTGLGGATATGVAGTNTLTTSANISGRLEVGSRIRLGAAGAVTTADTMGADTYTVTGVAGTTVSVGESLSTNYAGATVRSGLVSTWFDKSDDGSHASQGSTARMPLWISSSTDFNSEGTIRFFRSNQTHLNLTPDLNNAAGGTNSVFFTMHWLPGNSQMPFGFQTYDLWASNTNRFGFNTGGGNVYGVDPTPTLSNSTHQLTATFFNGPVAANNRMFFDGQEQALAQLQGADGSRTATDAMRISSWTNNTSYTIDARMSEFIVMDTLASDEARALIEQYQSAQWGITQTASGQVADAPGIFSTGYTVARTAESGTLVGDLTEVLGGVNPNYSIEGGDPTNIFSIDASTGEIRVANENALASSALSNFSLRVEADLGGSEPLALDVSIAIAGGNEGGFSFQIDKESTNRLTVDIGIIELDNILTNPDINIKTVDSAVAAFDVVQAGIDYVTERRAYVGSKQSQADYVFDSIGSRLNNQRAAKSVIADTDFARTSTEFANSLVKNQMSIFIAAQANQLNSDTVLSIMDNAIQL